MIVGDDAQPGLGGDAPRAIGLGDAGDQRQRLLGLAARDQQLGEADDRVLVGGVDLEHRPQAALVTHREHPGDHVVLSRRQQTLDELTHLVLGQRAHEAVDDLPVLEGVHGRDRLHPERLRDGGVLVDVDLDQHGLAVGLVDDRLDDRARACWHGPHHGAHRSTITTLCIERSTTSVWNVASVTSTAMRSTLSAALGAATCTLQA